MDTERRYFVGLDLAQASEYTALVVLERVVVLPHDPPEKRRPAYSLRHLQRFPLGTHYCEVGAAVRDLLNTPPLPESVLVVDQTGVGSAVVKLLADGWRNRMTCTCWRVTITAGQEVAMGTGGDFQIPKMELVGVLQVLLQTRRLGVARSLPDAEVLVNELENFKIKVPTLEQDSFEAWREGPHDDLLFAVALAAWAGEQCLPPLVDPPPEYDPPQIVLV
jgi:hypothetical protein